MNKKQEANLKGKKLLKQKTLEEIYLNYKRSVPQLKAQAKLKQKHNQGQKLKRLNVKLMLIELDLKLKQLKLKQIQNWKDLLKLE